MLPSQFDACIQFKDDRKIVVIADKKGKSIYRGYNNRQNNFSSYQVDGCILSIRKKCDNLLINNDERIVYFIELKGNHLADAVKQIFQTFNELQSYLNGCDLNGRIILSRVYAPFLLSSEYLKLKYFFKSRNGTLLQSSNNILEETL